MKVDQALEGAFTRTKHKLVSVELFPVDLDDKTVRERFENYAAYLNGFPLDFISVTFGAGGARWSNTSACVAFLQERFSIPVLVHITCIGMSAVQIDEVTAHFYAMGIRNFLMLRGDLPTDPERLKTMDLEKALQTTEDPAFSYALDLLCHVRSRYPDCSYFVAGFPEGHPATPHRIEEMDYLQKKCAAGAQGLITQMCFSHYDINDFIARLRFAGVELPVSIGLLPLRAHMDPRKLLGLALGARMPAALLQLIHDAKENPKRFNEACTQYFFSELERMHGYDALHLYLLNNIKTAKAILPRLFHKKLRASI